MKFIRILALVILISSYAHGRAKPDSEESDSFSFEMGLPEEPKVVVDSKPNTTAHAPAVAPPQAAAAAGTNSSTNSSSPVLLASAPGGGAPMMPNSQMDDDTHHDHAHPTPKVPQTIMSGALVHVGFNESCGTDEMSPKCDSSRELICDPVMKKCTCDPNKRTVYIRGQKKCAIIAGLTTSFSCQGDEQCQKGDLGAYSECDTTTGRCVCAKTFGTKKVIEHNNKCYVQKRIGEYCEDDEKCDATIDGKAVCKVPPTDPTRNETTIQNVNLNNTRCWCADNYVFNNVSNSDRDECLLKANSEESSCKSDVQCEAGLGHYSRCFGGKCQCVGKGDVAQAVFYNSWCFKKVALGDACGSEQECWASLGQNAVCAAHESYIQHEKVCTCPEGKVCEKTEGGGGGSGAGAAVLSFSLILAAMLGAKVVL